MPDATVIVMRVSVFLLCMSVFHTSAARSHDLGLVQESLELQVETVADAEGAAALGSNPGALAFGSEWDVLLRQR